MHSREISEILQVTLAFYTRTARRESKESTRDKTLDRQKKSHVTICRDAALNMLSSFLAGIRRHKRALMYNYQGQAGRQATVYYKRGSHLPDMRFTRPWLSWTALMSHNSLVDDSVISATTMDLIVGLALGSSCVHALASIVNCKMRTMR